MSGEIQAKVIGRRPVQAWVSCTWGRTTACDPHALGGDRCGEQPVKKKETCCASELPKNRVLELSDAGGINCGVGDKHSG